MSKFHFVLYCTESMKKSCASDINKKNCVNIRTRNLFMFVFLLKAIVFHAIDHVLIVLLFYYKFSIMFNHATIVKMIILTTITQTHLL